MVKQKKPYVKVPMTDAHLDHLCTKPKERKKLKDSELIVAHLLGGTSGLNLREWHSQEQIEIMVRQAVNIMREIQKQCRQ
jgi:hypothetical protein